MIEIEHLYKKYGKKDVVKDVSFTLDTSVYGLLGPNGAGKTTLLRLLAGVIYGKGKISYPADCKYIGYLPQKFGCFPELTVYEQMEYFACMKKIQKKERKDEIEKALEMVNLEDLKQVKCKKLSGGMVRRVGIAQAITGNPELILFDEPTVGLDVEERNRFIQIIAKLCGKTTILLSTHLVEDVKSVCKDIIIMNNGMVISEKTAAATTALAEGKVFKVKQNELVHIKLPYYAGRCETIDGVTYTRILTEEKPTVDYCECIPDLEDGYFWMIKNGNMK